MSLKKALARGAVSILIASVAGTSTSQAADPGEVEFRALYKELVELNTTRSVGSCTKAAEAMRTHLLAAGIPAGDMQILAPPDRPNDGALVAVLRGREPKAKPILLLAHIDVVEAKRKDWQRDPFKLVEEGGYFYARGAADDKAMASVFTDNLVRYRKEGFRPRRDIKLALTCGEETPDIFNTVKWLVAAQPQVLSASFALNEGAGGELDKDGRPVTLQIQAGEKGFQDFALEATDGGGHSARPTHSNPIVRLSAGLVRMGAHDFTVSFNPTTRAYFEAMSKSVAPQIAKDMRAVLANPRDEPAVQRLWAVNPAWNAALRTTCVVTQIEGGHADNALPQHVRAIVNCRILPGVSVADVQREIRDVLADEKITVAATGEPAMQSQAPRMTSAILGPAQAVAAKIWPGVPLIPTMSVGATDGRYLDAGGIPTYGLSGMFADPEGSHAHGLDERIRVKSLLDGRRFLYEVVKLYANGED